MPSTLPRLSEKPHHLADYCLSLSTQLVTRLGQLLPSSGLILSIGSGTGLLEALLQKNLPQSIIEGVEVSNKINKYLPLDQVNIVGGTWDLCSKAIEASALIFVYPREPELVARYLQTSGGTVRCMLWMGPRVDWPEYAAVFQGSKLSDLTEIEDSGVAPYEMLVVISRQNQDISTP